MTQPTPTPTPPAHHSAVNANTIRALISIAETVAFVVATVLAAMHNGSDMRNAIITALVGAVAHGVNHNSGGSPI